MTISWEKSQKISWKSLSVCKACDTINEAYFEGAGELSNGCDIHPLDTIYKNVNTGDTFWRAQKKLEKNIFYIIH